MDLQLAGKVALVTGASVGLGRAIAQLLADEGCRLAIVARGEERLRKAADEIAATGHERPLVIVADITARDSAETIRTRVLAAFGRLDILVNNAGGSRPFDGFGTREQWDEAMALNFHAGRELAHAFVPAMQAQRFGRIINLTGGDEPVALNGGVPPNGATHIWAKALSRVVGKDGITVNSIPPGRLHSEQIDQRLLPTAEAQRKWVDDNCPAGYIGEPQDLAVLVAFLASPLARYITGQVIHVDGGARRFSH
ncbi:SDR family oxidoreductase [Bosea sp. (in: a-proteobacteria)]|uniref:SDR family NAD(P)-dependent oxidoreductase n=1 Tax=Bosea sp. (in: a-proteobacteria) TaxID=1871050 RepID=UPI00261D059B|nr:SDR family oxidoreductase [Bosea sp. (in: a-proteobacteria)]MCO5091681.1 SDR family oxidoreductase [Bosea sp. (in: a-proteobacteria)]